MEQAKKIVIANLSTVIASSAVVIGMLFAPGNDYRWIGHAFVGTAAFGFLIVTVACGATLAGRVPRPPSRNRFQFHRRCGVTAGLLVLAALSYGLWMIIADNVRPLNTLHGLGGLLLVTTLAVQITSGLSSRRPLMKSIHRRVGYLVAALAILQVVLGVLSLPLFGAGGEYPRYTMRWLTLLDETWRPDGVIGSREYFTTRDLDGGNYQISYRTDGEYIKVGIKVKTTGWVGVGISAGDRMRNAEIVFAWVSDDGRAVVEDHFGVAAGQHSPDIELGGTDDITEFGGKEEDGHTIIEFKRPIAPDDKFDIPLVEGMQTLIWAYGADDNHERHVAQGYFDVRLR